MTFSVGEKNKISYWGKGPSASPLDELAKALKKCDFFTHQENEKASISLAGFYYGALEYEIGPEFYQLLGICMSPRYYEGCKNAQIHAINGKVGKVPLKELGNTPVAIDEEALENHTRNLFLLRSIRWYLYTSFNLLKDPTPSSLNHFRMIEQYGHECVEVAIHEGGIWEVIQFYFTIMPFSARTDLRACIDRLKINLDDQSRDIVQEQLFRIDALEMIREPVKIDPQLSPLEAHAARSQAYKEKKERLLFVIEKIGDLDFACSFLKADLQIQVKTSAVDIYATAWVLGIRPSFDFFVYVTKLASEALSTVNANYIHVQAIRSAIRAFVILGKTDKASETKTSLSVLLDRI